MTLQIDNVTKRFGATVALDGLAFDVPRGEVFGFLGANGAGKTTTMRICLGIVAPDAGEIRWEGRPVGDLPRRTWGYLPEERGLYPRMSVLDQLVYYASLYGETPERARREALAWLGRFRIPEYAGRRAEELSKGNQQKVQFIAAILHGPEVLLMDEPFTGLDPINLVLLREAFMELRDRGRTLIFSTHQMEAAEAMCESVAIVDHGRLVAGGPLRELKRASGRLWIRLAVDGPSPAPAWLGEVRGVDVVRRAATGAELELLPGAEPAAILADVLGRGATISRFEVAEPSLEALFIELVGHPADEDEAAAAIEGPASGPGAQLGTRGRAGLMARHDPLLPNAAIIARREYRDRVRGPLYLASTVVLMILALLVALAPIAIRYLDRQTISHVAVTSSDAALAQQAVAVADGLLNVNNPDAEASAKEKAYQVAIADDPASAVGDLRRGRLSALLSVERTATGGLDVVFTTNGPPDVTRLQLFQIVSFGLGVLDWNSRRPVDAQGEPFVPATFESRALGGAAQDGRALDPAETASRGFLGIVFVVLLFMTVVIYGMWVATGVAAEKSSRVMELMISAASPRQMLTGKVMGIGAAGLTQYVAISVPALAVLAFQDRIAAAVLGPTWATGAPLVGLTPMLLLGYAVFFLLGFSLFALIYAAMGSFVSRPDDLQTLSLPLSLLAVVGYLSAIGALSGGAGSWITFASFVPPFSPFVMLARLMVAAVQPWELIVSIVLLMVAVAIVAVVATRMYAAGVLLYGQRPGLRAFIAAARRAG